ncbi:hypothetical protein GWN42_10245 [candidate division KSB1 bacterium]|nr:hypothetical protein [candidate division KSB1 bacterium]
MKPPKLTILLPILFGAILLFMPSGGLVAQEEGKGDLEDFADDFGEEESGDDSESDEAVGFFLYAFADHIGDFARLWGGTPETEFGPFPSHPYAEGDGFMANSNGFRSYFFNTEFNYHYLNSNLRSYIFKWETQFAHRSKLSFDFALYEEELLDQTFGKSTDRLSFFGIRYGYALYRSQQLIVNLEGGFRGFHRNASHGGVELAVDLQLFPRKPLIIETELAAAYVSNGPLYTVESSAGLMLGRFELLGGIRLLKNQSADLLDGFRVGLRIWY